MLSEVEKREVQRLFLEYKELDRKIQESPNNKALKNKSSKILSKVSEYFNSSMNYRAMRYASKFKEYEFNEWKHLLLSAIWIAFDSCEDPNKIVNRVYNRFIAIPSKEVQRLCAKSRKTNFVAEKLEAAYTVSAKNSSFDSILFQIDLERALSDLPEKTKTILEMTFNGFKVLDPVSENSICHRVGLKDAAVYLKLEQGLSYLRSQLSDYKEVWASV